MEFRILGPLEVRQGEHRIPVTAPRQLAVLTSLVVRPGEVVSVDTIIDQVWGALAPQSAVLSLRNYIRRLRTVLPVELLATEPNGYRLHADKEQVDAGRFASLVSTARSVAVREPARASGLYTKALALWRGEPLANIGDCPIRLVQAPRLEELYLAALEDSIDVRLRLGEHAQIVPELTELTATYPLRERLCGQLMNALYGCHRKPEALAYYRRIRGQLVDELGIEPGPELRELEQRIQCDDLATPVPATVHLGPAGESVGRAHRPHQLPAALGTFVGRTAELAELEQHFRGVPDTAAVVCFLHGRGGVGKSTVAVQFAHQVADRYPDGILYVDLRGSTPGATPLGPSEVLRVLLRSLDAEAPVAADQLTIVKTYRARLHRRRVLVVLDNAANAAQVLHAIPDGPGCATLVTGRQPIAGADGATHIYLDTLPEEDSIRLLGRIVGNRKVAAEPDQAAKVAALCGHLPLALRVAANRAAMRPHWPLSTWVELLSDERYRLDELCAADGDTRADIRASVGVSISQLESSTAGSDQAAARLFTVLGALDIATHSADLAASITGWPIPEARRALDRLVDHQLLYSSSPGTYRAYDLINLLARERAGRKPRTDRLATVRRACEWYLATVRQANLARTGSRVPAGHPSTTHVVDRLANVEFTDAKQANDWLRTEIPSMLALLKQADRIGVPDAHRLLTDFVVALRRFSHSSRFPERLALAELLQHAAARVGDDYGQGVALTTLASVYGQYGDTDRAAETIERGLELLAPYSDGYEYASALSNRVVVHLLHSELDDAANMARRAVEVVRRGGYADLECAILNNLGLAMALRGEPAEGRRLIYESVEPAARLGDPYFHIAALSSVVEVSLAMDDPTPVADCIQRLTDAVQDIGTTAEAADMFAALAKTLHKHGREDDAKELLGFVSERFDDAIGTRDRLRLDALLDQLRG